MSKNLSLFKVKFYNQITKLINTDKKTEKSTDMLI